MTLNQFQFGGKMVLVGLGILMVITLIRLILCIRDSRRHNQAWKDIVEYVRKRGVK